MKIYVITKGSYSDYHICTVTTDKEKAEKLAKIYSDRYDSAQVEEYDNNQTTDSEFNEYIPVWFIVVGRNGSVKISEIESYTNDPETPNSYYFSNDDDFTAHVKLKDKSKAIKIALDQRVKMLSERFGL